MLRCQLMHRIVSPRNTQDTGGGKNETRVGDLPAIVPTIEGWAIRTGTSQITLDDRDPYMAGFSVTGTGVTVYPGP